MKIIILPNKFYKKGKFIKLTSNVINLCDILLLNNINIPHLCEKSGRCTSCLVTIKEGNNLLTNYNHNELENLNKLNYNKNSRLSCQIIINNFINLIIDL